MTYYATAGLGYGVDISHYGAPYQGMLGLGQATWSPGPGQTPADDPRMVKKFAVVRSVYRVRNVPSDKAGRLADLLLSRARTLFQGSTVRKIGTTGWMNDGRVGFEVILSAATRAGEIKLRNATARDVASQLGGGAELYDAQTIISPTDYMPLEDTMLPPSEQPVATMDSTDTRTIGGLPIWAAAGIGVAALGALALVMTRKKPVTSNQRKKSVASRRRANQKRRASRARRHAEKRLYSTKAAAERDARRSNDFTGHNMAFRAEKVGTKWKLVWGEGRAPARSSKRVSSRQRRQASRRRA